MRVVVLAVLGVTVTACGQRGPLFLPTDPAAKGRATLPDVLVPGASTSTPANGSATPIPANPAPATGSNAGAKTEGTR